MIYHVATDPALNEHVNGDAHFIKNENGNYFFVLIDGLGHGVEAAYASQKTVDYLASGISSDLGEVILNCHHELLGTRGVVIGIAHLDMQKRKWFSAGVGNIEMLMISETKKHPISSRGIVGYRIAEKIYINSFDYAEDDILIMHTDGIREGNWVNNLTCTSDIIEISSYILNTYRNVHDDATILIAK